MNNMHVSDHHERPACLPVCIAYVGGGSLNWAMGLMADLAHDTRLAAEVRLYDIDPESARRNAEIGARYANVSKGTPARYRTSPTLEDALDGADVVVISILPGRLEEMAKDIRIPAAYGIPQAVGDTVGPGGFIRALRAIPMLAEIARAVRDVAPEAHVCNLTNPMSTLTGTLHAVFPGIRAWGECHEVTKIRRQVAWIANQEFGQERYTHRDVAVNVLGINHFTFVDRIALDGQDMMPAYRAFARTHARTGWAQVEPDHDKEHARYFGTRNLVAFDLLARFGVPAAAGDRHLAEFMPARDYLEDPARWGFALTPIDYRVRDRAARIERAEALRDGRTRPAPHRSAEALIDQIAALAGDRAFTSNVNLPNRGQIEGLPADTIVETNAVFSDAGIAPVHAGRLPAALEGLVKDHAARQTALVDRVLAGDADALFTLFRTDPLVAPLGQARAHALFDEMRAATEDWIPDNLKGAA